MILKGNENKIKSGVLITLIIGWILYGWQIYPLFSEIEELTTPGITVMIKLLEFTNYRGDKLLIVFTEYFVLFTLTSFAYFYFYKKLDKNKKNIYFIILCICLVGIISIIADVFWLVYLLLTILSILIVSASNYVSVMIWGKTIIFDEGDIIFRSDEYNQEVEAEKSMLKKISTYQSEKISGDVFYFEDKYYFEVYANDKIILDTKGEIIRHEKN